MDEGAVKPELGDRCDEDLNEGKDEDGSRGKN